VVDRNLNYNECGKKSLKGAAAMANEHFRDVSKCLRFAQALVKGYRQFLAIKKEMKDWDSKKCSSCPLIDSMWETRSEMPDYECDMKLLCGRVIRYSSRSDKDVSMRASREKVTIKMIQKRFGKDEDVAAVWDRTKISVQVPYKDCKPLCTWLDKAGTILGLINDWAQDKEVVSTDFDLFHDRKRINGSETPIVLGMADSDDNAIMVVRKDLTF